MSDEPEKPTKPAASDSKGKQKGKGPGKPSSQKEEGVPKGQRFEGPERLFAFADSVEKSRGAGAEGPAVRLETWVTFLLGEEIFGLPVTVAQEILRVPAITSVPHAPYTVRGIINMRGRVVPVVDFRLRLGLGRTELGEATRILITSSRGRILGLFVDEVHQVLELDMNKVKPPPPDVMTDQSEYLVGVYEWNDRMFILLDVERVLLIPDSLEDVNRRRTGQPR